ncbi:microtubule-associated protein 11-like isoform X2 [Octopus sinensis]|uniref:Microtubule-associated protein 11-like isoform X2 n=1 Tax=Octopus sinensis TaxID=2607531 RepID=A0A7E6FI04_9MOLL|nr:microtubule-associated protein 11-like isoform X2 [Octopus sinensis]
MEEHADNVDEASSLELIVSDKNKPFSTDDDAYQQLKSVYIGQSIDVFVLVKYCPERDKYSDLESWRCRICQLGVHGCLTPAPETERNNDECRLSSKEPSVDHSWHFGECKICLSFTEGSDSRTVSHFHLKEKPYFSKGNIYVIPLSLSLTSVPGGCKQVLLSVAVWLSKTPTPTEWMALEKDFCLSPDSSTGLPPPPKTVTRQSLSCLLNLIQPPKLKCHLAQAAGKQFILLEVHNSTYEDVTISNCWVLPSSCHWATRSPTEPLCDHNSKECFDQPFNFRTDYSSSSSNSRSFGQSFCESDQHSQKVSLLKTDNSTFPLYLSPGEVLSLVFTVQQKELEGPNMMFSLAAHISWCSQQAKLMDEPKTVTTYSLPNIKLHHPPFVVSVSCKDEITVGRSFNVLYTISNKLQDFLALRLYWNPTPSSSIVETKEGYINIKAPKHNIMNSIICQDPDVLLGSCPKGSTMTANVRFQVLHPGLFELGQHMKLNLRYALPSSTESRQHEISSPTDSMSTLSPDEQLMASEELWRERSGSTSSVRSAGFLSCDERRRSYATKSYSFGDLGPASSSESDTGRHRKFKNIERSPRLPPPRPPPPRKLSRTEQIVTNPRNFLKESYQLYLPQIL